VKSNRFVVLFAEVFDDFRFRVDEVLLKVSSQMSDKDKDSTYSDSDVDHLPEPPRDESDYGGSPIRAPVDNFQNAGSPGSLFGGSTDIDANSLQEFFRGVSQGGSELEPEQVQELSVAQHRNPEEPAVVATADAAVDEVSMHPFAFLEDEEPSDGSFAETLLGHPAWRDRIIHDVGEFYPDQGEDDWADIAQLIFVTMQNHCREDMSCFEDFQRIFRQALTDQALLLPRPPSEVWDSTSVAAESTANVQSAASEEKKEKRTKSEYKCKLCGQAKKGQHGNRHECPPFIFHKDGTKLLLVRDNWFECSPEDIA
jgi:hypothetical protein